MEIVRNQHPAVRVGAVHKRDEIPEGSFGFRADHTILPPHAAEAPLSRSCRSTIPIRR